MIKKGKENEMSRETMTEKQRERTKDYEMRREIKRERLTENKRRRSGEIGK